MINKSGLLAFAMAAVLFASGCGTTASSGGGTTTSLPVSSAASAVGSLAMATATPTTISSAIGVSSAGISKASSGYTFDSDGWLEMAYSGSAGGMSYSYDMKVKLFGEATGHIYDSSKMALFNSTGDTLEAMFIYSDIAYNMTSPEVMSFTVTTGSSKTDPLKYENMNTASPTITGPASYTGTYGAETVSVTLSYSALTMDGEYPDGSVSFAVALGTSPAYSGTISFNGTNSATITFSTGEIYTVNLTTGAVS